MMLVYNGERLEAGLQRVEAVIDEWRFDVGDWLNEGEGMMPEEVYGYLRGFRSPMALRQYAWVSRVTRVTGLSWSHHREVAALPPAEGQEKLEQAKSEGMSRRDLHEAVHGDTAPRARHPCPDCGQDHVVKA
jgi:hypothetical protein